MSKITNDGLTRYGTGYFIAVPIRQQWASKGHTNLASLSTTERNYCWFLLLDRQQLGRDRICSAVHDGTFDHCLTFCVLLLGDFVLISSTEIWVLDLLMISYLVMCSL